MFINLYEFAVGKGLLQREPEFGQHLISTTERFLSLAKTSSTGNESSKEDEPVVENKGKRRRSRSQQQQPPPQVEHETMLDNSSISPPGVVSVWGYEISHEGPSAPEDVQHDQLESSDFQRNRPEMQMTTPETSANFFEMMNNPDMNQYRVEVPPMETYAQYFPHLSQVSLPLPQSFAYTEKSFARRLHREACQRGYKLICSPNPNPKRFKEVFSFTLRYCSKAHVKARLEKAISSSSKDSLQAWKEPFIHLGGAGTYFPMNESDKAGMPKFNSGLSMGPFPQDVMSTRENFLENDMKTFVPDADYEGQFYDPNDVESYLRGRGINITDDMQYVSLDLGSLIPYEDSEAQTMSTSSQTLSPRTPMSAGESVPAQEVTFDSVPGFFDSYDMEQAINIPVTNPGDVLNLPLRFADWHDVPYEMSSPKAQDSFDLRVNPAPIQQQNENFPQTQDRRLHRVISINVNTLLQSKLIR